LGLPGEEVFFDFKFFFHLKGGIGKLVLFPFGLLRNIGGLFS